MTANAGALATADQSGPSGRTDSQRVADIAYRLSTTGRARCAAPVATAGLTLVNISDYELPFRASIKHDLPIDRGPAVRAVAAGGPAEAAGLKQNNILLAIDGQNLPANPLTALPFDQTLARQQADLVDDLIDVASRQAVAKSRPMVLTLLDDGAVVSRSITPVLACPSRIHLARSARKNAYADGIHVWITTGVVELAKSDDELAFVLGHEMAHNILGHAALLKAEGVPRGMTRVIGKNGHALKQTERAADQLGGELVLDAGYDLMAGSRVLKLVDGDFGLAILNGHDNTATRITALRTLAAARTGHGEPR